jgi:hypothetical protein
MSDKEREAVEREYRRWQELNAKEVKTADDFLEMGYLAASLSASTALPDPPETPCFHCGKQAAYLCDFILSEFPYRTCDRALCEQCRTTTGVMFFCQTHDDGEGKGCEAVSRDYCRKHAPLARAGCETKPLFNPIGGPKGAA